MNAKTDLFIEIVEQENGRMAVSAKTIEASDSRTVEILHQTLAVAIICVPATPRVAVFLSNIIGVDGSQMAVGAEKGSG